VSTARLVGSLACGLQEEGHEVTVLTTAPHYNRDLEAERKQPIQWNALGVVGRSRLGGVGFLHVAMPRKGRSVLLRLLGWVWFHAISTALAWFALPKFDVVIAPSPPLTIGVSGWLVCRVRGSALVYNVQEIYPDVAVQLGALRHPALIGALHRLERFVYDRSDAVTVISAGMEANLRAKGVPPAKLQLIPNHVDAITVPAADEPNSFSTAHALNGKFVVSYAGNIGKPQGLDIVVGAAEALRHDGTIRFVVLGDGSEKREIERLIDRLGLNNILVLPYQPYSSIPEIYAASSICLVLQAAGTGGTALPSKAVQIVGAGRPFVAVADADSDLATFVKSVGSGLVFSPGRPDQLAACLTLMKTGFESWLERARAAQHGFVETYSRANVVRAYSELITHLSHSD
jgi:putative colanic acid biosynthesis glycosyltransferase WcaI